MDAQFLIALLIVGLSAAYVLRLWIRRWSGKSEGACGSCAAKQSHTTPCGGGCPSRSKPAAAPARALRESEQLKVR